MHAAVSGLRWCCVSWGSSPWSHALPYIVVLWLALLALVMALADSRISSLVTGSAAQAKMAIAAMLETNAALFADNRHSQLRVAKALPKPAIVALNPYFEDYNLNSIRIREQIPSYVISAPRAYTDRSQIYFEPGAYNPNTASGIALIGHELLHCRQYAQLGTFRFRLKYLREYLVGRVHGLGHLEAYENISFEKQADALQRKIFKDLRALGYET